MGRDVVVKLSAAWGGLRKHKPLVEATLARLSQLEGSEAEKP
jgi:hypothetical protein